MRLSSAQHAVVDPAKLRDYCLNPKHPRGRHKARVFAASLGMTADGAYRLPLRVRTMGFPCRVTVTVQGRLLVVRFLWLCSSTKYR